MLVERRVAWHCTLNADTDRSETRSIQCASQGDSSYPRRSTAILTAVVERPAAPGRHGGGRDAPVREHDARGEGKISNPGFDKLRAIAKAMNSPPGLWFEEADGIENATRVEQPAREQGIADRLNHLFEAIKKERTGEPYTNAEVPRMSLGDLTEEEVGGIRAGMLENPTISQVLALAEAFGVHPSYFLERSREPTLLGEREITRWETGEPAPSSTGAWISPTGRRICAGHDRAPR